MTFAWWLVCYAASFPWLPTFLIFDSFFNTTLPQIGNLAYFIWYVDWFVIFFWGAQVPSITGCEGDGTGWHPHPPLHEAPASTRKSFFYLPRFIIYIELCRQPVNQSQIITSPPALFKIRCSHNPDLRSSFANCMAPQPTDVSNLE